MPAKIWTLIRIYRILICRIHCIQIAHKQEWSEGGTPRSAVKGARRLSFGTGCELTILIHAFDKSFRKSSLPEQGSDGNSDFLRIITIIFTLYFRSSRYIRESSDGPRERHSIEQPPSQTHDIQELLYWPRCDIVVHVKPRGHHVSRASKCMCS